MITQAQIQIISLYLCLSNKYAYNIYIYIYFPSHVIPLPRRKVANVLPIDELCKGPWIVS